MNVKRILLEKPAFASITQKPAGLSQSIREQTLIGFNLRFHPVVLRALNVIKNKEIYSAFFYVGQYLPDWRPHTDYKLCYSADKVKGGGVLRDLSHEMDLACLFTGSWQSLAASGDHLSSLEISSEDVFSILSKHDRCPQVLIHQNYLDRTKRRYFILNFTDGTLYGDLVSNTLSWNGDTENFDCDTDTTYKHQLMTALHESAKGACTFAEGMDVMLMIDAAETAASTCNWIYK
jgi:predicted dehydrogenase